MTDKELRRLSRSELLEMLIIETKENARLRSELEQARAEKAAKRGGFEKKILLKEVREEC